MGRPCGKSALRLEGPGGSQGEGGTTDLQARATRRLAVPRRRQTQALSPEGQDRASASCRLLPAPSVLMDPELSLGATAPCQGCQAIHAAVGGPRAWTQGVGFGVFALELLGFAA